MKNHFLFLFCLFLPLVATAQDFRLKTTTKTTINNTKFIFKILEDTYEDQSPETILELYRGKRKLLSHIISYISGDSNSISIELGKYEIKEDSIIFYSYWALVGDAPVSPYGVRKQTYHVQNNGKLRLADSQIYLEACRAGWGDNEYEGVDYIYTPPSNEKEEELFTKYKNTIEKEYHATFVTDNRKKELFDEVRKKMEKEIAEATKGWEEWDNSFGFKK